MIQPGSNGVLTNIDEISKEALRKGSVFLIDLFNFYAHSENNLESMEEKTGRSGEADWSEQDEDNYQHDRDEL